MYSLENFLNTRMISRRLRQEGLSDQASVRIAGHYAVVARTLLDAGHEMTVSTEAFWVPGRIEVLGKHTDYAGGQSLLVAVERGFAVLLVPDNNAVITIERALSRETLVLDNREEILGQTPDWSIYPVAAWRRLISNFGHHVQGGHIAFYSDLPVAAGMSSSSAFLISICLALQTLWEINSTSHFKTAIPDRVSLADYMGHVENGQTYKNLTGEMGVGTFGGSQDHAAILCAKAGTLMYTGFNPTAIRRHIPLPDDLVFCVASSGVRAEKTEGAQSAYNRVATRATNIMEIWNAENSSVFDKIGQLVLFEAFDAEQFINRLAREPEDLAGRMIQFYNETQRYIPGAIQAIEKADYLRLGEWVDASQADADKYLYNQIPETLGLARMARESGAIAASAFGAGFGGSVWALVNLSETEVFLRAWEKAYFLEFPMHTAARFFKDKTGPAAFKL